MYVLKSNLAHGTSSLRGRGVHNKVDGTWLHIYPLDN